MEIIKNVKKTNFKTFVDENRRSLEHVLENVLKHKNITTDSLKVLEIFQELLPVSDIMYVSRSYASEPVMSISNTEIDISEKFFEKSMSYSKLKELLKNVIEKYQDLHEQEIKEFFITD